MPIVRTYGCKACGHFLRVTLDSSQVDAPPPKCPECARRRMHQEFQPVALGGSHVGKAVAIAEQIAAEDYGVADLKSRGEGEAPKVRYKDQQQDAKSTWQAAGREALETVIATGRQDRLKHGSPLDAVKALPDFLPISKARSIKGW